MHNGYLTYAQWVPYIVGQGTLNLCTVGTYIVGQGTLNPRARGTYIVGQGYP